MKSDPRFAKNAAKRFPKLRSADAAGGKYTPVEAKAKSCIYIFLSGGLGHAWYARVVLWWGLFATIIIALVAVFSGAFDHGR